MNPFISIIMPTYNRAGYIEEALDSIKKQTFTDYEIIVVDDGSETDLLKGAGQHSTVVKYIRQENQGVSVARNTGLEAACGEYVQLVDADDWLDSNYLSTLLEHAGNCKIVQSGYRRVTNEGAVTESRLPKHFYQFASPCMRLYRTAEVQDVRFPLGMIYEDVIFSLRLWAKHPTYRLIPYIGYNYRLNPNSTTSHYNKSAQQTLYAAIRNTQAPWWLKIYTILRLKFHFRK